MRGPKVEEAAQDANLRLFCAPQALEHRVELGNRCERMRERLGKGFNKNYEPLFTVQKIGRT